MKFCPRLLIIFVVSMFFSGAVTAEDRPQISLSEVKAALSSIQISKGPDSSRVTRSPWGPGLYHEKVSSVVLIEIFEMTGNQKYKALGQGTGVVISPSGMILTNWHVVWPYQDALVLFYPGTNTAYEDLIIDDVWYAVLVDSDQARDLALLQISSNLTGTKSIPSAINSISLEEPELIQVGQDVFAIGHPEGLHWTYTEGVISQIRPRYRWESKGHDFQATIVQTQTAVSYGSSGGPLINRNGKLVGIISHGIGNRAGFNFAISVHELRDFLVN